MKEQALKIKAELVAKGVTQRTIARECKVSDTQVSRVIKNCDAIMSRKIAETISAKIGKPLAEVFPNYTKKQALKPLVFLEQESSRCS